MSPFEVASRSDHSERKMPTSTPGPRGLLETGGRLFHGSLSDDVFLVPSFDNFVVLTSERLASGLQGGLGVHDEFEWRKPK